MCDACRQEEAQFQTLMQQMCPNGKDDPLYEAMSSVLLWKPEALGVLLADESDDPYGIPMVLLATIMLAFHMAKDEQYGRSWAKRGESGVFHNFMRKEDRLDKLAVVSMLIESDDPAGEEHHVALIDQLLDRALYGMMWVSYIAKTRREHFKLWLERSWCPTTSIPLDVAMGLLFGEDAVSEPDCALGEE